MYAAYRLFDLDTWAELRRLPETDARAEALFSTLKTAGQKLCGAHGVVFDEAAWTRAATKALNLRDQMLRRSDDKRVDNRAGWRSVIESGAAEPLTSVVLFYLSTWDGTGAVERGLGRDAAIHGQHVGDTPDSCAGAEVYSFSWS